MNAATIVARNYVSFARVLADSYARHHPGRRLAVLLADETPRAADADEPFEPIYPSQLGLEPEAFHRMAAMYDATELATALKPPLLRYLLADRAEPVVFLDPDVEVHAPLDELGRLAEEHGIVLTPHSLRPFPRDGDRPSEIDILRAGVFNLGCVAVGTRGSAFLDWWGDLLRFDSVLSPEEELFVDQRVVDLVPSYFDHWVLRDPGYNVAYWNLFERDVVADESGYTVNGEPLRFFHFSGFDPERPTVLSKYHTRVAETRRPAIRQLCRAYAERLFANGYRSDDVARYRFKHAALGMPFDRRLRRLYREALRASEAGQGDPPPDPFEPAACEEFIAWVRERGKFDALSPARVAASHVTAGPDAMFPVRWVGLARRLMLRMLRHYDEHQRKIQVSMLGALSDVDRTADAALTMAADLTARIDRIERAVENMAEVP